jgi:hypothetical protein
MMLWDFPDGGSHEKPDWADSSLAFTRTQGRAAETARKWNWFWERRAVRELLRRLDLSCSLASEEREFLAVALSAASRAKACEFAWQIEAAACIAWALRLVPRLWPMDEQFEENNLGLEVCSHLVFF